MHRCIFLSDKDIEPTYLKTYLDKQNNEKIFKLLLIALLIPAWTNAAGWDEAEYKRIEQSIQLPDLPQTAKVYDISKYGAKLSNPAAQNQKAINKLIALVSKREADAW